MVLLVTRFEVHPSQIGDLFFHPKLLFQVIDTTDELSFDNADRTRAFWLLRMTYLGRVFENQAGYMAIMDDEA
ncbi:hypothetical protein SISSUDRAFT_80757 [Sistotremastrum suecicum HHB10207 ss-3]|uniref:Uncharacterized protein n=1 Tax=Sistotremastrum suecicum HHB10207 ss-3 TaxID=1314776 RepID=A0A166H4T5_9AGAM|nr:hypothetical protein SISSUDRAFT_80757 [Sistotremastrum suecicum HHB10207 ss-3]